MARKVKVKLNLPGINAVMKSPGVVDVLGREARSIAHAAGPGFTSATDNSHPWVARAWVRAETRAAKVAEARHKVLTRAAGVAGGR
jgi:hypothetical protein